MFKNYFKSAWRNFIKNKAFSFLNITGLTVGMAVTILLGLWIWGELSFNSSFTNYSRVAMVMQTTTNASGMQTLPYTPYPLAEALRREHGSKFSQVVLATGTWMHTLKAGPKQISQTGAYMEAGAGKLLDLQMLSGVQNGLQDPSAILLSHQAANAIFGNKNAIGQVIQLDKEMPVKVAGIYKDIATNSTFAGLQFIAPWQLLFEHDHLAKSIEDPWRPNSFFTYVELAEHEDINKASAAIRDVRLNHVNSALALQKPQLLLHPMRKWHLFDEFKNGVNTGGAITYVWLFGIIGVFVLLLACINFMNLSTARSIKRAKEVGIRKAVGSLRGQLILQFFSESVLYVAFAFVLSLGTVLLSLPVFNEVAGKQVSLPWSNPTFWLLAAAFCTFTGLAAGLYPALYLSSFNPIKVLKGTLQMGRSAGLPRKALIVLQFTVSITMIIGTLVVFRQIQYVQDRPLGYNRNGLVSVNMNGTEMHKHFDVIKAELEKQGAVASVTESFSPPTNITMTTTGFSWQGKDAGQATELPATGIGYDYGKTVGWNFKGGRDFSRSFLSDSSGVILNEAAVQFMGFKNPLGETITWDKKPYRVIGVVKNMVMESPFATVRPTVYYFIDDVPGIMVARLNPKISAQEAIRRVEAVYKRYSTDQPFDYQFTDEQYEQKFGNEKRIGSLAGYFTVLAIFISCLGLIGMASFMAEQRSREIGVRKVLGASVTSLWQLLSGDFVQLAGIAFIVAAPLGWYVMHTWLQEFAYRSSLSWWLFAAAGLGTILITLLTVSFQAMKAALVNPVKSLKSE